MEAREPLALPHTLAEWERQRIKARATLWTLLGDLPPLFTPEATVSRIEHREGFILEHFTFDNGADATVYGYLLIPDGITASAPAILYHHAHGHHYQRGKEELFRDAPMGTPPGKVLVESGYIVAAIDAYAFGQREFHGPTADLKSGAETELALSKKFLWQGTSMWGMMVRDDLLALNYLLSRPEVNPARVGTTGMSLGGSRATWLTALDERLAAVIPVAQMTRYEDFARSGNFNLHSIYYYVPGMLKSGLDMEIITSLTAPRPQRILIGDQDPLSPVEGVRTIDRFTHTVYELYGSADRYEMVIYEGQAHTYSPQMFEAMLEGFKSYL
jgi:dienelactone hydrolase